jgi:chromosome segregation ATPase
LRVAQILHQESRMSDQTQTFFSRIGSWFRRGEGADEPALSPEADQSIVDTRSTFLRPWARRDQAIHNLQEGFHTLTDLMGAVRDNLEKQSRRQDELLGYLSHLPRVLETIPESNRIQGETLKAIHQQIQYQNEQQKTIADILGRINESGGDQRQIMDELRDRVEMLNQYDQAIADNLKSVGAAMQSVSQNSQASAQVLENMRDNVNARDGELERILQKQNTRFTTMLAIAIFLSVAALVTVVGFGYMLWTRVQ